MFNLISQQPDIDKTYLYAKDPYERKCQFLIDKQESAGLKHFHDPKAFRMIIVKTLKNIIQTKNIKY